MWQYNQTSNNELYHWKYATKKKVNGKWRYYYDDTGKGKPKKGLSINDATRSTLTTMGVTTYGIGKGWLGNNERVSKDVYDHADKVILYNGEPVVDIGKRKVNEAKKAIKPVAKKVDKKLTVIYKKEKDFVKKSVKKIDKAKKWLSKLF